jgi:hypothetical protein
MLVGAILISARNQVDISKTFQTEDIQISNPVFAIPELDHGFHKLYLVVYGACADTTTNRDWKLPLRE